MDLSKQTLIDLLSDRHPHFYALSANDPGFLNPKQMAHLYINSSLLSTAMEFIKDQHWLQKQADKSSSEATSYESLISPFFNCELIGIRFLKSFLIARGPGVPVGKVVQEPVSTLDLAPTFMDYAQAEPLGTLHGQSLRDLIETDSASREYAYNEWELLANRVGVQLSLRTVRTKTHKLTLELGSGAGELYDLVNDPHEMVNCFDDPAYATIRAELTAMIAKRPDDAGPIRQPVGAA